MQFRESGITLKTPTSNKALSGERGRRFLSRRYIVCGIAGAAILAGSIINRVWIRADGIISGELTAVSPIVQARLETVFVKCLDRVVRGQRLAEFDNELTVEAATQQLKQLELQLTQARAIVQIAGFQADAAYKAYEAQVALHDALVKVLNAYDELVQSKTVATLVWEKAKADVARSAAEVQAALFVYDSKLADQKKAALEAEVIDGKISTFKNAPELTGHFFLSAPKDGIVTECAARPGEVIPAKTPIFQIFNPDDAYAVAFFDPNDGPMLALGQEFSIRIGGLEEAVTGQITGYYPELGALPVPMIRYFWQEERWSQYAPVRIDLDPMTPAEKTRLRAGAQLSVSRWHGAAATRLAAWRWVVALFGDGSARAAKTFSESR
jgi:multidrug resistance efflux pump